jgi:hypothetical protein
MANSKLFSFVFESTSLHRRFVHQFKALLLIMRRPYSPFEILLVLYTGEGLLPRASTNFRVGTETRITGKTWQTTSLQENTTKTKKC